MKKNVIGKIGLDWPNICVMPCQMPLILDLQERQLKAPTLTRQRFWFLC